MPSRIALHPGHPGSSRARRSPPVVQVHSFRRSCFSRWLGKEGFLRFVVAITPLSHGPNCRCLPVCRSVPWPDRYVDDLLRVGPPFWQRSPSDGPSSGRFTTRNQDVLTGLHLETDEYTRFHPVFCFRSICQRTTRYHTLSPNTRLPMWCPRPRHRSNGTFPSGPTVSRLSKVVACTIIQAMVFDSGGICIWQLNSSSFLSVLISRPDHFQHDHLAQMSPRWLRTLLFLRLPLQRSNLHHSRLSIAAYGHL